MQNHPLLAFIRDHNILREGEYLLEDAITTRARILVSGVWGDMRVENDLESFQTRLLEYIVHLIKLVGQDPSLYSSL
jgi:hypothetical protein